MLNNMDDADAEEFIKFVERNWNVKMTRYAGEDEETTIDEVQQPKKRGRKPINK